MSRDRRARKHKATDRNAKAFGPISCPYCKAAAVVATGAVIYPHRPDLAAKRFWLCEPCDAYVGCHPDGAPMGRLANAELRKAKMRAHAAFDPIWKDGGCTRGVAYSLLAEALGLSGAACHIGYFDVATCDRVVVAATSIRLKVYGAGGMAGPRR